jgi:uncharacterized protein YqhQ
MSDYLQYGGQAVIEGVMMRSPRFFAVACRKPDGTIIVQEEPIEKSIIGRLKWMNRPMLRGTLALVDAMALGLKAMSFSAKVQAEETGAGSEGRGDAETRGRGENPTTQSPNDPITQRPNHPTPGRVNDIMIGGTMVVALCVGIALFVALPTWLTRFTQGHLGVTGTDRRLNIVDGVIRIAIFLAYIGLISLMQNIRRVFQYHGAEHKAINTLEDGEEVTMENCLRRSRIHPRCGTSFIIVVLVASILVHSGFPRPENYFTRLALHIALIPLVAGFAYEVIKLAGRFRSALPMRALLAPGLWSQRLTTREPDPDQVEVAMAALNAVLAREREADRQPEPAAV